MELITNYGKCLSCGIPGPIYEFPNGNVCVDCGEIPASDPVEEERKPYALAHCGGWASFETAINIPGFDEIVIKEEQLADLIKDLVNCLDEINSSWQER